MMKSVLVIIPARAGSKRLKSKNTKEFAGKPLVYWSISAALECFSAENIIVSTDDPKVNEVACSLGCPPPFLRPSHLSSDEATSFDVVEHAIPYFEKLTGKDCEWILLLQPTSPLRVSMDIKNVMIFAEENKADSVISVCKAECPLNYFQQIGRDGKLLGGINLAEKNQMNSLFRFNGSIYLVRKKRFCIERSFILKNSTYSYEMPRERSVDIDTIEDFEYAEFLMKTRNRKE